MPVRALAHFCLYKHSLRGVIARIKTHFLEHGVPLFDIVSKILSLETPVVHRVLYTAHSEIQCWEADTLNPQYMLLYLGAAKAPAAPR